MIWVIAPTYDAYLWFLLKYNLAKQGVRYLHPDFNQIHGLWRHNVVVISPESMFNWTVAHMDFLKSRKVIFSCEYEIEEVFGNDSTGLSPNKTYS